jgi:hypothetical protein
MVDCTHGPRKTKDRKDGRRCNRIRQHVSQNSASDTLRRILARVQSRVLPNHFWRRQCKYTRSHTVCDGHAYRRCEGNDKNASRTFGQVEERSRRSWQRQKVWVVSLWLVILSLQKPSSARLQLSNTPPPKRRVVNPLKQQGGKGVEMLNPIRLYRGRD